jgi:hypothetical protein
MMKAALLPGHSLPVLGVKSIGTSNLVLSQNDSINFSCVVVYSGRV